LFRASSPVRVFLLPISLPVRARCCSRFQVQLNLIHTRSGKIAHSFNANVVHGLTPSHSTPVSTDRPSWAMLLSHHCSHLPQPLPPEMWRIAPSGFSSCAPAMQADLCSDSFSDIQKILRSKRRCPGPPYAVTNRMLIWTPPPVQGHGSWR